MVLAGILILAAMIDIRWVKNRYRIISKVYVSPTYHALPPAPSTDPKSGTAYALNDRLRDVSEIGLGRIEGPEDVFWTARTNSMPARATATSFASFRRTTSAWKSTRISAALR